jgi:AraC-like DNA-binding protein
MEAQDKNEQILTDYSGFKRMSFLPGENSVDDVSVMEINTTQGRFSQHIIPEQYFVPTYCMQFILKGELRVVVNNQLYTFKANEGFLITPDFLVKKPDDTENHVEMRILALSRRFLEDVNPQFPLTLISHIYVCPHWQMSAQKLQRTMHYLDLLRELTEDKDRTAAVHLVRSLFHYLAGENLAMWNDKPMSRNEEITGRFMHMVDAYCEQHHDLDWYAGEMCLSTRYVANTVKETLGMTASACIEQALMQRAKTLLYTTTKSIQEIADELGFQNQSHFGTFFKRHEGVSPAAFRKKKE